MNEENRKLYVLAFFNPVCGNCGSWNGRAKICVLTGLRKIGRSPCCPGWLGVPQLPEALRLRGNELMDQYEPDDPIRKILQAARRGNMKLVGELTEKHLERAMEPMDTTTSDLYNDLCPECGGHSIVSEGGQESPCPTCQGFSKPADLTSTPENLAPRGEHGADLLDPDPNITDTSDQNQEVS